jgi:hypothetical protein
VRTHYLTLCVAAILWLLTLPHAASAVVKKGTGPDAFIVVYSMPDEEDHIACAYSGMIPHAQATRDFNSLQAAAGGKMNSIKITDAAPPVRAKGSKTTSIEAVAPHMFHPTSPQFSLDPFLTAYRSYSSFAVTFFLFSDSVAAGSNTYSDPYVTVKLNQTHNTATYWVTVKDPRFRNLKIPDLRTMRPVLPATDAVQTPAPPTRSTSRPALIVTLLALAAVAGAGVFIYASVARHG